ncbi:hypothetical protein KO02_12405 [Sphingobacterium sp. ML3W]|nr:hypothetical protein KO02_12405 [Sphingobacterium sp. ML3W]
MKDFYTENQKRLITVSVLVVICSFCVFATFILFAVSYNLERKHKRPFQEEHKTVIFEGDTLHINKFGEIVNK